MAEYQFITYYSVLVSVSCPKALYQLESDNIFHITVVVADWLGEIHITVVVSLMFLIGSF